MKQNRNYRRMARLAIACVFVAAIASLLAACGPLQLPLGWLNPPSSEQAPAQPNAVAPTEGVAEPAEEAAAPAAEAIPEEIPETAEEAAAIDEPTPIAADTPEPEPTDTPAEPTETTVPTTPTAAATATAAPTPTATSIPVGPILSNPDGQFTMLLLGYGGPGHDGPYLTDSMMVVIANPAKKTVTMLSLARDSWVPLSYTGGKPNTYDKINTAYAYAHDTRLYTNRIARYKGGNGAGNMAKDTVSQILGIPIDYYVAIDFTSFKSVVDTLGGIDVNVPNTFSARYPANDNPDINPAWTVVRFTKGPQHLNGTRALQYARAREVLDNSAEVGDFARATRQRLIISAIKDRTLQPAGLLRLPQLLAIAKRSSVTDYPLPAVANLAGMVTSWGDVKFYQAALSTNNYLQAGTGRGGTYILLPRNNALSWGEIRAFARRLWQNPTLGTAQSQTEVMVINRSGQDGLAGQVTARLRALGYEVDTPETGAVKATSGVVDQSGGKGGALAAALGPDLGLPTLKMTAGSRTDPGRIVLELGKDALGVVRTDLPPAESGVPTSTVGVEHVGSWSP